MTVNLSPGGVNLYRSTAPPDRVFAGTAGGVVLLTRSGAGRAWEPAHRSLEGKHVTALATEPAKGTMFAGTFDDSVFASEDGGVSWEQRAGGITEQCIYCMNYVVAGEQVRLYAGTDPAHLFVSSDLGLNWRELSSLRDVPNMRKWRFPDMGGPEHAHVKNIMFRPGTPDTIYAAIEVGALLKSEDAGATWKELPVIYEDVHRTAVRLDDPEHVYITTGDGIYESVDGGESWDRLTDQSMRIAYPDGLIIHPENQQLMFTSGAVVWPREWRKTKTANPRVARSRNAGRTWEILGKGMPEELRGNIEALSMEVWPGGSALFAGTADGTVYSSEDEGDSWSLIADGLPPVAKNPGHYQSTAVA